MPPPGKPTWPSSRPTLAGHTLGCVPCPWHPGTSAFRASPGVPCLRLAASHSQLPAKVNVLLASTQRVVNTTIVLASFGDCRVHCQARTQPGRPLRSPWLGFSQPETTSQCSGLPVHPAISRLKGSMFLWHVCNLFDAKTHWVGSSALR